MNNSDRLLSLDVFRGATIAFMILVNNQGISGNAYGPLAHGGGYEVTPTDWVFPFFLFIVGVAMPFSFAKQLDKTNATEWCKRLIDLWALPRSSVVGGAGIYVSPKLAG